MKVISLFEWHFMANLVDHSPSGKVIYVGWYWNRQFWLAMQYENREVTATYHDLVFHR